MKRAAITGLVVALVAVLCIPCSASAAAQGGGDRVQVGGDIVVAQGERVDGDVVVVGGNAIVDGVVTGNVVAVGGYVSASGQVDGDVIAVGGYVVLRSTARVGGDSAAIGGRVEREPGAQVGGDIASVPILDPQFLSFLVFIGLLQAVVSLVALLLAALLSVAAFPGQVKVVESTLRQAPWASVATGLAVLVVFIILAVPLVFTIIGLPLAILGLIVATLFGLSALGALVGDRILAAFRAGQSGYLAKAIVGVLVIWLVGIIPVLGGLVSFFVTLFAVGAVALSRFGNISPPFTWQAPRSSPPGL